MPPAISKTLVYLGQAVELKSDVKTWTWRKSDNFIVSASQSGHTLIIFRRTKTDLKPTVRTAAKDLYRKFSRKPSAGEQKINVPAPKKRVGRVEHIVYRSNKFGSRRAYIHKFDTQPCVWVDIISNPRILTVVGGHIKITKDGIEG